MAAAVGMAAGDGAPPGAAVGRAAVDWGGGGGGAAAVGAVAAAVGAVAAAVGMVAVVGAQPALVWLLAHWPQPRSRPLTTMAAIPGTLAITQGGTATRQGPTAMGVPRVRLCTMAVRAGPAILNTSVAWRALILDATRASRERRPALGALTDRSAPTD